ncbi:DUF3164 family protein [Astrobacterium formosum]|uniref:DUF3164 family protein n=1 Tax=Astrobacterium formosum TaxID=3069710 RepID=UPI003F4F826A
MTQTITPSAASALADGTVEIAGQRYMRDGAGRLVPLETVNPRDKLTDEQVRKIMDFARKLSAQIKRFKDHTFDDLNALQALFDQEYGAKAGGPKGNVSFVSFDGTLKVQVQIADQIVFGPELQAAKKLVDECLVEWGAESRPEMRAVVNRAFAVEKEGQIDRAAMFSLLRLDIVDERWMRAMDAVRGSIRVMGSKAYVRFYERDAADGAWRAVTIDLAAA